MNKLLIMIALIFLSAPVFADISELAFENEVSLSKKEAGHYFEIYKNGFRINSKSYGVEHTILVFVFSNNKLMSYKKFTPEKNTKSSVRYLVKFNRYFKDNDVASEVHTDEYQKSMWVNHDKSSSQQRFVVSYCVPTIGKITVKKGDAFSAETISKIKASLPTMNGGKTLIGSALIFGFTPVYQMKIKEVKKENPEPSEEDKSSDIKKNTISENSTKKKVNKSKARYSSTRIPGVSVRINSN